MLATGAAALRFFNDGDPYIYDCMADAYLHKKNWSRSEEMSEAALARNANDAVAHENLGESYLGMGRLTEARAEWRKVLTLKDTEVSAQAQKFMDQYP